MKNITFLLPILLLGIMSSCEHNTPIPPEEPIEPTIVLQDDTVNIKVGLTYQLVATITPDTAITVIWATEDPTIATVNESGLVTAIAEGTTAIIASGEGFVSDTCVVNVTVPSIITLQEETLEMYTGTIYQLNATITPEPSTSYVFWNSSNKSVATVDNKGLVIAVGEGTTTIIASRYGMVSDTCIVNVKEIVESKPFPRKFLIEHFTTEQCGYCPGGMYAIVNHLEEVTTPYIWVSHHYGYGSDEYTINDNEQIGQAIGVSGAPNMVLNRTQQAKGSVFHPGYLPDITITDNTMSEASIAIEHTFDASTRKLDITVSGEMDIKVDADMLLTVLIKENGLVGKQADYQYSWQTVPWKEFMHTRVVRDVITNALGDVIHVKDKAYSHTLTYTLAKDWNPENCCIVAYLTPMANKPIINVEQTPIVGTTGGEQYIPYGITEGKGPKSEITFHSVQTNQLEDNVLEILLISNNSIQTAYGNAQAVGIIYLNTDATTLQEGTYPVSESNNLGTITAGYRIDEKATFGGSLLAYAVSSYLQQGNLACAHFWRINSGEMVVDKDGNISFTFTTYGGTTVNAIYEKTNAEANIVKRDMPIRKPIRPNIQM